MHSCLCLLNKIYSQHLNFNVKITTPKERLFVRVRLPYKQTTPNLQDYFCSSTTLLNKILDMHFFNYKICCIKSYFNNNSFQLFTSLWHVLWWFNTATVSYDHTCKITVTHKFPVIIKWGMVILFIYQVITAPFYIYFN